MDLNKVMLIGRITSDAEVKKIGEGVSVVNFSLATNRVYNNKKGEKIEEAEFHRCVAFGKTADIIGEYSHKGDKIYVEGRLRTRQWEDESGNNRYTTEILVNVFNILSSNQKKEDTTKETITNNNIKKTTATKKKVENVVSSIEEDDEIPF